MWPEPAGPHGLCPLRELPLRLPTKSCPQEVIGAVDRFTLVEQGRQVPLHEGFVLRIHYQFVQRLVQECRQVMYIERVECTVERVVEDERSGTPVPSGSADPLPRGHERVREPRKDHSVETTDIDTEFQRVRGENESHVSRLHFFLNTLPFIGQESTPENPDTVRIKGGLTGLGPLRTFANGHAVAVLDEFSAGTEHDYSLAKLHARESGQHHAVPKQVVVLVSRQIRLDEMEISLGAKIVRCAHFLEFEPSQILRMRFPHWHRSPNRGTPGAALRSAATCGSTSSAEATRSIRSTPGTRASRRSRSTSDGRGICPPTVRCDRGTSHSASRGS